VEFLFFFDQGIHDIHHKLLYIGVILRETICVKPSHELHLVVPCDSLG